MGDLPGPITDLLAVLMLSVAVYCIGRLVFSLGSRWTTQRETDAVHTVMAADPEEEVFEPVALGNGGVAIDLFD